MLVEPRDREFLDANVGNKEMDDAAAERVRDIITRSGALNATRSLVDELREKALAALVGIEVGAEAADALRDLAVEATLRDS
jgi:geranylgeranyl diphosphate synthase type I